MTAEERETIRLALDLKAHAVLAADNALYGRPQSCPRGYGTETGYSAGCRCDECRADATAKRSMRRRLEDQETLRAKSRAWKHARRNAMSPRIGTGS